MIFLQTEPRKSVKSEERRARTSFTEHSVNPPVTVTLHSVYMVNSMQTSDIQETFDYCGANPTISTDPTSHVHSNGERA